MTGSHAAREIKVVPSHSYLPVTSEFGRNLQSQLLQLLLPVLLILPVARVAAASHKQKGQGAEQEQGPSGGSVDFSGICNNNKNRKMLSLGERAGVSRTNTAPTGAGEAGASQKPS